MFASELNGSKAVLLNTEGLFEMSNVENSTPRRSGVMTGLLLTAGLTLFAAVIAVSRALPQWHFDHRVLRSVLEALGCMTALGLAGFLIMRRDDRNYGRLQWIACSALAMGILNAFHASLPPGEDFVGLLSIGLLVGGVLAASVWLPQRWLDRKILADLPKLLAIAVALFAIVTMTFPEILPGMLTADRNFTAAAKVANAAGGALFVCGFLYFVLKCSGDNRSGCLIYAVYCLLLAVSGLAFAFTRPWHAGWWLLNLTRLTAFIVAFRQVSSGCASEYHRLANSERAVRELASIVKSSHDAIIGHDLQGTITSWNEGACKIYGRTASEMIGKSIYDLVAPHRAEDVSQMLEAVTKRRQVETLEATAVTQNGDKINISLSMSPVKDADGKVTGASVIIRDISAQKKMQSQLIQNEKLASIGQLAAGVAHEMNSPVGFVASNFETLENYIEKVREMLQRYDTFIGDMAGASDRELAAMVSEIESNRESLKIDFILDDIEDLFEESREGISRVTGIIRNLRDFSRIDHTDEKNEFDLNQGIRTTLTVARNEIKYYADVEEQLGHVPAIRCDSGQINQVLLNLLVNAAQAIRDQNRSDRGKITVKTYEDGEYITCKISDDGPGIEPDKLSRVFDAFFTTKPVGKGTGLGLSVSYDIITNKHNGQLLVDSETGEGTTFTIKLPAGSNKEEEQKEIINHGKKNCTVC